MKEIVIILNKVRIENPLVFHLTNHVTTYDCANVVKVLGASPVMSFAFDEAADMTRLASSLVLNIGTLTNEFVDIMKEAIPIANERGIPVILDVCGAGATKLRDSKSFELLNGNKIDIIKGNASEVARIAGINVQTKGVDSGTVKEDLMKIASNLAEERDCTVVITGKEDYISDACNNYVVNNGHQLMASVVGTGCMASSIIGTFSAVEKNYAKASMAALCCFEIASEIAANRCRGPGSFKSRLFDSLYSLNEKEIMDNTRVL